MLTHPTAIVDPSAQLGEDIRVGPYAIIEAGAIIGDGCSIGAHSIIRSGCRLGQGNIIHPHVVLGGPPQDQKYQGEDTLLQIGENNVFREFFTANRGTVQGGGCTRIGSHNLLMTCSHVAHDCQLGDHIVMANSVALAGHVVINDHAVLGGLSAVHQHVRIGESALVGGGAMIAQDLPPYCIAQGDRARLHGLNRIGLRRRGFSRHCIDQLHQAYRILFLSDLSRSSALTKITDSHEFTSLELSKMIEFIRSSRRGICKAHRS